MIERMDHVGIVVDDLAAATEFFVELGLELQGKGPVEGRHQPPLSSAQADGTLGGPRKRQEKG
jgi:catechol 2,3-dioxygenase-like lactoylglutathione lyase family enzyme